MAGQDEFDDSLRHFKALSEVRELCLGEILAKTASCPAQSWLSGFACCFVHGQRSLPLAETHAPSRDDRPWTNAFESERRSRNGMLICSASRCLRLGHLLLRRQRLQRRQPTAPWTLWRRRCLATRPVHSSSRQPQMRRGLRLQHLGSAPVLGWRRRRRCRPSGHRPPHWRRGRGVCCKMMTCAPPHPQQRPSHCRLSR